MANPNELTLVAQLGSGGMADVFLAIRRGFGGFKKLVVIKRLRPSTEHNLATMFRDEARLAARLNHPNVVQTFRCEEDELEMEFLDGQSLHRILRRAKTAGRKVDLPMVLHIVHGLLSGLHYAHELADFDGSPLNVIHRDVSPQNLFITYSGKIKLIDFGIAKVADQEEVTEVGIVKGKVRFMAPEQARADVLDRRVDVFASGILMWELLTGERYWGKGRDLDIVGRLRHGDLGPSPDTVNPDVPPAIAAICQRALAFDREDRYATCADFLADLESEMPSQRGAETSLGALVDDLFVEDRKTLRRILDEAMAREAANTSLEPGLLAKITRSGVHSRSDFTALPMSHTNPPQVIERAARPSMPIGWVALAAGCLTIAAALIGLRLPVPHRGAAAALATSVSAESTRAGDAAVVSESAPTASPAGSAPGGGAERRTHDLEADEDDDEDSLLDSSEPVYK